MDETGLEVFINKFSESFQLKFGERIDRSCWNLHSFINIDFQITIPMRQKSVGFLPSKDISKFMIYFRYILEVRIKFRLSEESGLRGS
jgi:hypothetical protein